MSYIKECEEYILNVFKSCGYDILEVILEVSSREDLGEFQVNTCMSLAKKYGKNPRVIAEEIISNFDDRFENVNIAGPGFINVSINKNQLLNVVSSSLKDISYLIDKDKNKTIIIDYGGANAAKTLHIGHMRSANIGESLKRLSALLGNKMIGDVHLGDIGRQSGMVISEIKKRKPNLCFFDKNYKGDYPKLEITPEELSIYYPSASNDAKENPERMEEVRKITALVDEGIEPYISMWKDIVEVSKQEIKKTYDYLNCHFDLWEGELSSLKYIKDTLKVLEPYMYESDKAKVIDVKREDDKIEFPPLIVIKNDGSSIYATRDLATIYSRIKRFDPEEIIYVVDERQGLYFEQVFRAAYKTHLVEKASLLHCGFGTINGIDGKPYKTRDGGVMELSTLIDLVRQEITKKIKPDIEEKEEIIEKLTIATIKYTDLLPYRKTDYIFDPVKFSSLEGKTGPYILYTVVRIKSILNKINAESKITIINNEEMRNVLVKLTEVSNALTNSYKEKTLNYITEILYEICSLFNKFYNNYNIINEENKEVKESYIAFIKIVYNYIKELLNILAIEEVDKM